MSDEIYTTKEPLSERMRPTSLDTFVGQKSILALDKPLRKAIENKMIRSLILWGPPGVGKTSLALLIAHALKRPFVSLSAISAGVKDLREVIQKADGLFPPVLFIDEIHRFSKSQQDSLLLAVEKGQVTLIGATTENPSFELNAALLSRCQVYVLESLEKTELEGLVHRAIQTDVFLKTKVFQLVSTHALLRLSGGDARKLLNLLELVALSQWTEEVIVISDVLVEEIIQKNAVRYDKSGEQHYDIISAFIKSIRGSDPHAALYWFGRMWNGGEEDTFIARRLLILAAEDIGLANPTALILAKNCFDAVKMIGKPESRIILAEAIVYLAGSPKSNSSYLAVDKAIQLAKETSDLPVPLPLRNAPTRLMKELGYSEGYLYSHGFDENFAKQNFLPDALKGTTLYSPGTNAREKEIASRLDRLWKDWYK
ncbi:MAG: replication-associated recombination protein A [Spirosomataceae bacterium]